MELHSGPSDANPDSLGVRDQRKCDHALLPIVLPRNVHAKASRSSQEPQSPSNEAVDASEEQRTQSNSNECQPWRQTLELHVVRLLQQLHSKPQQWRQLLLAASEPSADCLLSTGTGLQVSLVDAASAYRRLRLASVELGEQLYGLVRALVRRSELRGVLSREAQAVRLASLYKLELRRHVTASTVLDHLRASNRATSKPLKLLIRDSNGREKHNKKLPKALSSTLESNRTVQFDTSSGPEVPATSQMTKRVGSAGATAERVKSAHDFKMQALERLLDASWANSGVRPTNSRVSGPTAELVQERVTAFLYHRSRENFPLWRDLPTAILPLSREDTARQLRALVTELLASPLFQGLSIEQLLEVARAMKWRFVESDQEICRQGTAMDTFMVVLDGSVTSGDSSDGVEAVTEAPRCFGEIGMVRNDTHWPHTLRARPPVGVKALALSKSGFEALLQRFFSGKAVPPSLSTALHSQRPMSSPAGASTRSQAASFAAHRPQTASAKEANVIRWHQVRDKRLSEHRVSAETATLQSASQTLDRKSSVVSPTPAAVTRGSSVLETRASPFQYYPCFPSTSLSSAKDSNSSTSPFQLKWMQPLAFAMAATDTDELLQEWAPAFPATRDLVDFLAPSSSQAAVLRLFDKPNVLLREHLKAVCTRRVLSVGSSNYATPSTTQVSDGPRVIPWVASEGTEEVSFSQFSEARKRLYGRSNSMIVGSSPSASGGRNPLSFAALAKFAHMPFTGAHFVADTHFFAKHQRRRRHTRHQSVGGSSMQDAEVDDDPASWSGEDSGDGDWIPGEADAAAPEAEDSDVGVAAPETQFTPSSEHHKSIRASVQIPRIIPEDTDEQEPQEGESPEQELSASSRRKSALESMIVATTAVATARRSKLLDQETARQVLVQKHFANNAALSGTRRSSTGQMGSASTEVPSASAPLPLRVDLQRRMDAVLTELHMTPKRKLALVLKYTHADFYDRFPLAVLLWEQALSAVLAREHMLRLLRDFELLASDPRRHFRSLSTHRLREEKERDALFAKLGSASDACNAALEELQRRCGDSVFLRDRNYRDKMRKDYTELLFDVEQERLRIIYRGVHPYVAPAAGTSDNNSRVEDRNGENQRRTLMCVRVPTVTKIPPSPAESRTPCVPLSGSTVKRHENWVVEAIPSSNTTNQSDDWEPAGLPPLQPNGLTSLSVAGMDATASGPRHQLKTLRESIYKPIDELQREDAAQAQGVIEKGNPAGRRTSRVALQVQQQRQAELQALTEQLYVQHAEAMIKSRIADKKEQSLARAAEKTSIVGSASAVESHPRPLGKRSSLPSTLELYPTHR